MSLCRTSLLCFALAVVKHDPKVTPGPTARPTAGNADVSTPIVRTYTAPPGTQTPMFATQSTSSIDTSISSTPQPPRNETPAALVSERYFWTPLSGFVAAIIAGVIGMLAYDRLKRRVRTMIVHNRSQGRVLDELQSLYLLRIDPNVRISPHYLTHFLQTPTTSLPSARAFLRQARQHRLLPIMHLLIAAKAQGEIVGLLKALYLNSAHLLFVAYAAVQANEEGPMERRALMRLFGTLKEFVVPGTPIEWIAFELSTTDLAAAKCRERLFRQHAKTFGIDIRRVDIEYRQPDLDCIQLESCHEEPAALYLGATRGTPKTLDLPVLRQLLQSILYEVYLPTWSIDHTGEEQAALRRYVSQLTDDMLRAAPERISLL